MSRGWKWKSGDWWVSCDVCAKQTRASEIKKRWDGFLVCPDDFEMRHEQDFLRTRPDKQSVPFSRNEIVDNFTTVAYVNNYVEENYFDLFGYVDTEGI